MREREKKEDRRGKREKRYVCVRERGGERELVEVNKEERLLRFYKNRE